MQHTYSLALLYFLVGNDFIYMHADFLLLLLLLLLLLQSALQPLWVLACSTIVEYSQQEVFYRVPLAAARQSPNVEDQGLESSKSRHQASPTPEKTPENPSSGRWKYGREIAENFAESGDFRVTYGFFLLHAINLARRVYFPFPQMHHYANVLYFLNDLIHVLLHFSLNLLKCKCNSLGVLEVQKNGLK